jgi:tetratricopeptide (TPR) repeat protein
MMGLMSATRGGRRIAGAVVGAVVMAAGMGGCNTMPKEVAQAIGDYQVGNYGQSAALLKPFAGKRNEDYVLNNCRLGSAALAWGQNGALEEAQQAFMNAYQVLNSTNINDPGRQVGVVVLWEGVKVWKGEPFEQAMAHYYLGLIFLIKHDYDNARAAFQNSLFKVREYASKDNFDKYKLAESNFALGYFGLGFCNMRMGKMDLAQAAFARAQEIDPSLAQVIADAQQPGVNTLIFVDAAMGPQKMGKGWYSEESVFGPTPQQMGPALPIVATVDGQVVTRQGENYGTVDTLAMAQERRWQDIDTLRKAKAIAGTGLMAGGTGAMTYGAIEGNEAAFWGGLGALAAGALLSASSQADLRAWGMLPRTVFIVPATLPPGEHTIEVSSGNAHSAPLVTTVTVPAAGGAGDNVFYFRLMGVYSRRR